MTVCGLFWLGPVTNKTCAEEVAHDHVCVFKKKVVRHNLFVSYRSVFLHEIGGILWLTLWRCCRCSYVHLSGEPVSSYFFYGLLFCCFLWLIDVNNVCLYCYHVHNVPWFGFLNTWVISALDCRLVALNLYATGRPVFPKCMQLTLVSWYVTSTLCCPGWMFSLSDALPVQTYPSKLWVLCQGGITYLFSFLPICVSAWNRWCIMANTLKMLNSWYSRMFILLECSFY